jgi:hypothetical protein
MRLAVAGASLLLVTYFAGSIALVETNRKWGQFIGQPLGTLVSAIGPPDDKNGMMGTSYWHGFGFPTATLETFSREDPDPHDDIQFMQFILFDTSDTFFHCPLRRDAMSGWDYLVAPLHCSWSLKA